MGCGKRLMGWCMVLKVGHRWIHVGRLEVSGYGRGHSGRMVVRRGDGMGLCGRLSCVIVSSVGW